MRQRVSNGLGYFYARLSKIGSLRSKLTGRSLGQSLQANSFCCLNTPPVEALSLVSYQYFCDRPFIKRKERHSWKSLIASYSKDSRRPSNNLFSPNIIGHRKRSQRMSFSLEDFMCHLTKRVSVVLRLSLAPQIGLYSIIGFRLDRFNMVKAV